MLYCLKLCSENALRHITSWKVCHKSLISVTRQISWKPTKPILYLKGCRNSVGKLTAGIGLGAGFKLYRNAHCEAANSNTRIATHSLRENDPNFEWAAFFDLLKPYIKELIVAILAALACSYLSIHIPRVLGEIINVVVANVSTASGNFLHEIKGPAVRMLSLYALLSAATFVYILFLSKVGEGVALSMKTQLFSNIMRQDISFFDGFRSGEILNRLTIDVNDFKSAFKMVVSQGIRNSAQVFGCAITLYSISPQLTGIMLLAIPSVILAGTVLGSFLRKLSFEAKKQIARLTLLADEALGNIRTVRAFAMERLECAIYEEQAEKARELNERLGVGIGIFQSATSFFLNGMILTTIYVGGSLLSDQKINSGDLMAYLVALQILQRSFTQLSLLFGTYVKGLHAGARVFEMMKIEPKMNLNEGKTIPYHTLIPEVEFKNVTFTYPTRPGKQVLTNFSLKIPVGKTIALVGASGSGKSTIACLLERYYDVDSGSIEVGGQDIRSLNPTWLRGRVLGLISQEPVLFATNVMENIRYGRPEATDAEVIEAAKMANADEFIRRFPDGYSTMVGERGVAVSGGQKQRIAIARAILKNPSVLILDEATSALDTESEHIVQAALEKVMMTRTTVVIAHRLSTIQKADLIVVINNGAIVEVGTHSALMSKKGVYASLVEQQRLAGQN